MLYRVDDYSEPHPAKAGFVPPCLGAAEFGRDPAGCRADGHSDAGPAHKEAFNARFTCTLGLFGVLALSHGAPRTESR